MSPFDQEDISQQPQSDSPFQQGAQQVGSLAGMDAPTGASYGGELPADKEEISTPNPEEPKFLKISQLGVFGDSKNSVDFKYGGASTLPDGNVNPENFARVKESLVKSGALRMGDSFRVLNPETKKVVPVIVRDIKPDNEPSPAIDVAPHVVMELGGTKNLLIHTDPVKGFPVAQYSAPYQAAPDAQAQTGPTNLSQVNLIGAPQAQAGMLRNASAIDSQSTGPAKSEPKVNEEDGSLTYPDGTVYYKDDTHGVPHGKEMWVYDISGKLIDKRNAKGDKRQLTDFTDKETGQTYKAIVDMDTGEVVKKFDDPSSRANAQAEMLRLRILNSAKSQPGIVAYVNVKNNYDSLAQNAAIPPKDRTPADDAAAIQAFGAIEHPGTGVTDADKKQAQDLVGKMSKLKIWFSNWTNNSARILDVKTVNDMRDAAKRALDGRQKTYNDELAPLIKEAKKLGLSQEQVNGALGANIATPESKDAAQPSASPNSPDEARKWLMENPDDPAAEEVRKRLDLLKK